MEWPGLWDGGDSHDLAEEATRTDQKGVEGQRETREAADIEGDPPKALAEGRTKWAK